MSFLRKPLGLLSSLVTGVVIVAVAAAFIVDEASDPGTDTFFAANIQPIVDRFTASDAEAEEQSEGDSFREPPSIRVAEAEIREVVSILPVNGTIVPREEAAVGTDLSGLTITELEADVGDVVKQGDLLARLDPSSLQLQRQQGVAQRAQAEAQLSQSNAQIVDAEVAVAQAGEAAQRQQQLRERGINSQSTLDDAVYARRSAEARLETARRAAEATRSQLGVIDAQIADVDRRLSKTEVRAPADGLVLERNALLGGIVGAGADPLFRLAIGSKLELAANVAESELPRLEQGMSAQLFIPGADKSIEGEVRLIDPQIDRTTRLGTIYITLGEGAAQRAGSFARGEVEVVRRESLTVPTTAIVYDEGNTAIQQVDDGVVRTTRIETGVRDGDVIEVTSGLEEGAQVVARAGTFVADGDKITPVVEEQQSASNR